MTIDTFIRSEIRTVLNQNGGDFPTEDTINKLTAMVQGPSEVLDRIESYIDEFSVQSIETAEAMSAAEFIDMIYRLREDVKRITQRRIIDVTT
jgi:hypothetical protein